MNKRKLKGKIVEVYGSQSSFAGQPASVWRDSEIF